MTDNATTAAVPLALRPREAARLIGISERSLWAWTHGPNPPPCIRRGRLVLYPVEALREWLNTQAMEPRP